jgi:Icc-related predicted phosphoesterase
MSKFWASPDEISAYSCDDQEDHVTGAGDDGDDHVHNDTSRLDTSKEMEEKEIGNLGATNPTAAWERIRDSQVFQDVPTISTTAGPSNRAGYTRLVVVSDTHGQHRQIHLPKGDILIHGGDFTKTGEVGTIEDLSRYFAESGFRQVAVIAGNHDMTLHPQYYQKSWHRFHRKPFDCTTAQQAIKQHCQYLNDSAWTSQSGLNFYGSPYSPYFFGWAFNRHRGDDICQIWDQIPSQEELPLDVLITHTPPLGRGDLTHECVRAGCYDLLQAIQTRIKPRVSIFGHIHEGYGTSYDGHTLYVNASNLDVRYNKPGNRPIVIDISHVDKTEPARVVMPANTQVTTQQELEQWCKEHRYECVAAAAKIFCGNNLPLGDELLQAGAFWKLLEMLKLHRSNKGRAELEDMLGKLYAECF